MKIVQPSVTLINPPSRDDLYKQIERAGRVCYKSEDKITEDSAEKFIRGLIKRGHEAVIEHGSITALFVCVIGVCPTSLYVIVSRATVRRALGIVTILRTLSVTRLL